METHLKILIICTLWMGSEIRAATRYRRLSLAEPSQNYYYNHAQGRSGTYNFGYDINDPGTANVQYRKEERFSNGTVMGSYGYLDPFGRTRRYQYIADGNGYRVYNVPKTGENFLTINGQKASTESSITWTRPTKIKKKKIQASFNGFINTNKYNNPKPPSYYAID